MDDDVLGRWDPDLDTAEWVTLPEAAAAAGVSVSALRTWYRTGDVESRMERGPHGQQRLVRLADVVDRAARGRRNASTAPEPGAVQTRTASTPPAEGADVVSVLGAHLARADARAERLEAALRTCEEARRAAEGRAAAAEAERDVLRRLLDQRD